MHDCRETKEQVTELLLNGADCLSDEVLAAALRRCADCRNEFDALNATLRIAARSREFSAPTEDYWTTYHAKLRQRLATVNTGSESPGPSLVARFFRLSVPVPAPVVVALIAAFAVLVPFAIGAARQPVAQTPSVLHVPVEVPVVREKVVTRVVYRERRPLTRPSGRTNNAARVEGAFAKSQKPKADILAGFKPAEEVKLTVIKGGSANEK